MGNFCEHGNHVLEEACASCVADGEFDDCGAPWSSGKPCLEDRFEWEAVLRQSYERRRQIGKSLLT